MRIPVNKSKCELLAHLSQRLMVELIVYLPVTPVSVRQHFQTSSETTGPVKFKEALAIRRIFSLVDMITKNKIFKLPSILFLKLVYFGSKI